MYIYPFFFLNQAGLHNFFFSSSRYFPYEDESNHKLIREIGNVTTGLEITFQFAVKPKYIGGKMVCTTYIC